MKIGEFQNYRLTDWGNKDYIAKTKPDSETFINSNISIQDYNSYDPNDINLNFDEESERALYFINVPQDNSGNNPNLFSEYLEKDENIKEKNSNNNLNFLEEKIPENISEGKLELNSENTKTFNSIKYLNLNNQEKPKNISNLLIEVSPNYKNIEFKPRKYFRVDDAKKHFKVAISHFAKEQLNILIKESDLPKHLKKKIHLPNNLFTSNSNEFDNFRFLSFDLFDVFTFGKKEDNLQGKNFINISNILNYNKFPKKSRKIKEFISMKYEDIIKMFYCSEEFKVFRQQEKTIFFDNGIKQEKNISLLEDGGLIDLFRMTNKKRKREMFCSSLQE